MKFTEEQVEPIWNSAEKSILLWRQLERETMLDIIFTVNAAVEQALEAAKGTPIEPENVLEGDVVRGMELSGLGGNVIIEGVARKDESAWGRMRIGGYAIGVLDNLRLIHRPTPQLPTKAPAFILATEVRGVKGEWQMMLRRDGFWFSHEFAGGTMLHQQKHITAWKLADFVVREEEL